MRRVLDFGKMRTIVIVPEDPWSKDTTGWNPKEGGGAFAADFRNDRISGRHRQVLLRLMLISMQLSALCT